MYPPRPKIRGSLCQDLTSRPLAATVVSVFKKYAYKAYINSERLPLCCLQSDAQYASVTPSLSSEALLSLQRGTEHLTMIFKNPPTSVMRSLEVIKLLTEEHIPLMCSEKDSSCYTLKS